MKNLIAGIPCLGALLAFCVPYSSSGGGQDPAPPVRRKWVCPLSDDQQQKAPKAFAAMTPTFLHPRCVNCHGVVDTSTGDFHLGGVVDPTARETRTVHRKNPETGADEKITEQVPLCSQCHIDGWTTPDPPFFFKGKDSVRLCRQMKGTMDNADRFMGHISKDATLLVPFIQESFKGTRGLTPEGQHYYQTETNKKYETEEEKPPISHATFIAQAQAWVDAMGGKFHGDRDCGCVPHHYILSIDMKSNSDFHVADSASHTEMSIHTEIPLEFKDDGSFETEGQMSWVITGYQRMRRQNCDFKGSLDMRFKMKGRVDEDKERLHLEFTNSSATQSGKSECSDGTGGTTSQPYPTSTTSMPFDMPYFVDEDYDVPMPGQNPPAFTSSTKLRINQKD
jgi:hypothetical protein